ncbi:hypothetical protein MPOCJGCO_4408 [Methylobacterium trifolii]|uniref:Uncharacterized protein n=1 Tax=Methylobacterium trifolii TaxID=1003092 RepID=A0ABQ4U4D8_9HYPH|nr:hypothetical protein MPOCJGCO_4408 [Methylobacterium trifolii]
MAAREVGMPVRFVHLPDTGRLGAVPMQYLVRLEQN